MYRYGLAGTKLRFMVSNLLYPMVGYKYPNIRGISSQGHPPEEVVMEDGTFL